jgi:hypothetical protein
MSFSPAIPYSGADAWVWMRENQAALQADSDAASSVLTDADLTYFETTIGSVSTIEALLSNTRLLRVAMGAFGLGDDGPRLDFLDTLLRRGTDDVETLARDYDDPRYIEFTRAFGFGEYTPPKSSEPGFAADIAARFRIQAFEQSVGAVDADLRRALIFEREMASLAGATLDDDAAWNQALANDSIARVLKSSLDLRADFDRLSARDQRDAIRSKLTAQFGDGAITVLSNQENRDNLIKAHLDAEKAAARSGISRPQARLVGSGFLGFEALSRSLGRNLENFAAAGARDPDLLYFEREITKITGSDRSRMAEEFVADKRLVKVALTAFGLGDVKPTDDFMQAVLLSDPADPDSVAAAQDDPRWAELAKAFGFGSGPGPQLRRFGFFEEIADRHHLHRFEASIGAQDADMRSALLLNRGLQAIANSGLEDDEAWRAALGQPPIAMALKTALGLEDGFAALSTSGQITAVKAAMETRFGSDDVSVFANERRRDDLLRGFFRNAERDEAPRGGIQQPVVPLEGLPGWRYLQETLDTQRDSFAASAQMRREIEYFTANIGEIETAEQLVSDRRLLAVALEAFGLGPEIDKRAYIQKVLEEGTDAPDSMANRLADSRFRKFAEAFGFGNGAGARTSREGFAESVIARYRIQAFETAVGDVSQPMRQALYFDRQSVEILGSSSTDRSAWLTILGDPALRSVVETAFNLPSEFSQADLDYQVGVMRDRASSVLGSSDFLVFADAEARENVLRRFFIGEALYGGSTPFSSALALLQGAGSARGLNTLL